MQTSYSLSPEIARAGLKADSRALELVVSRLAAGAVKAGYGVFRVPGYGQPGTSKGDPGSVYQNPSPAAAVDVDAIITAYTTSTGIQTFSGATLNGAVGAGNMFPARKFTGTLSSHADWDATNLTLTGKDQYGRTVSESIAIPNGGNATITSVNYYTSITSVVIPAQSGTGGTATFGIAVLDSSVTLADFEGVALYDHSLPPLTIPSQDSTAEYQDHDAVSVMYKGAIWVVTEDACSAGAPVYVRVGSGTASQLGAFRSDGDSASAVVVTGARYQKDSDAAGLNIVEFY